VQATGSHLTLLSSNCLFPGVCGLGFRQYCHVLLQWLAFLLLATHTSALIRRFPLSPAYHHRCSAAAGTSAAQAIGHDGVYYGFKSSKVICTLT
jgi:hypothetical protein